MPASPSTINFTTARVENFRPPRDKTQSFQWDAAAPGLGQLVSDTSSAYVFQYRFDGKTARITIGKTAVWRLQDAREEARRLRVMVDTGRDPRQVKAAALAATKAATAANALATARDGLTLATIWPIYLAEHKADWSEGHYRNHVNLASAGGVKKLRNVRKASDTTGARAAARLADAEAALAEAIAANDTAQEAARHGAAFNGHDFWAVHSLMAVSEVTYANLLDARRSYNAALAAVQ